jgi:trehalose-6-phosphatase
MLFAIQGIFYVAEIGLEVRSEGHQQNTNNIQEVTKNKSQICRKETNQAPGYFIPSTLNCLKSP